jgi:hypothetical protein
MISQKWQEWIISATLILGSTCVMLFFSEIALRVWYPQQLGVWHQTRDGLAIHRPNSSVYSFNRENYINSLGMRDREHSIKKKDGAFRILLLGDSFMEAFQVRFDESFPKLLEDRLRESGIPNVEVINAAVSGWGTEDELAYFLRYGKQLEPDLTVVAVTLHNDISDNMREQFYTLNDGRLIARPVRETPAMKYLLSQLKGFVAAHSHLFQLWRRFWYRKEIQNTGLQLNHHMVNLLSGSDAERMERGWQLTFQELRAIQIGGRGIGAETAVVLIPLSLQLSKDRLVKLIAENNIGQQYIMDRNPQDMMIKFGTTQGIQVIDLLPTFKQWRRKQGTELYLERDGHWNPDGHEVAANTVAGELLSRGLVKSQR